MSAAVEPDGSPEREAGHGWRLFRVAGIPVYLSPSWLLLAAFVVFAYAPSVQDSLGLTPGASYLLAGSFAALLLGSTLAHELGHCLAGRGLGLPVRRVRIFVLGGSSDLGRNPATPAGEYLVAMAGPLVSLVLACAGWSLAQLTERDSLTGELVRQIAWANTLITVFNLLPALPLDGGRVLRAGVWRLTGSAYRGSVVGAWGGRVLAVLLVLVAVRNAGGTGALDTGNVLLGVWLAVFLWVGATAVLRGAQVSDRLAGVSAAALTRRALPVDGDLPLAEALRRAGEAGAGGLVVVDGAGRPDALVSEAAVQATPPQRRPWVTVGSLARRLEPGLVLRGDLVGEDFLAALRAMPAPEYLVVDAAGSPVGVLAAADVARTLSRRR